MGDVFRIPVADGRFGHGWFVRRNPALNLYIAVFGSLYDEDSVPDVARIVEDEVAFLGHTVDAQIWWGRWPIVGNVKPDPTRIPLPAFKYSRPDGTVIAVDYAWEHERVAKPEEVPALRTGTNYDPSTFVEALSALHGLTSLVPPNHRSRRYEEITFEAMERAAHIDVVPGPIPKAPTLELDHEDDDATRPIHLIAFYEVAGAEARARLERAIAANGWIASPDEGDQGVLRAEAVTPLGDRGDTQARMEDLGQLRGVQFAGDEILRLHRDDERT